MIRRNFSLQKENDCKVYLRSVKCCTCCYCGISYITFSTEQISHMPFYYVQDVYHKNQLGTYSAEKEVWQALTEVGGLSPCEGDSENF